MRKLIESTLVSLDGVIEAPERCSLFDDEATAIATEQLDHCDAFVMGRVTYEKFFRQLGPRRRQPVPRPHQRHAQIRGIPDATGDDVECDPARTRPGERDRPTEAAARQGPDLVLPRISYTRVIHEATLSGVPS
jgi:hypothetical protein